MLSRRRQVGHRRVASERSRKHRLAKRSGTAGPVVETVTGARAVMLLLAIVRPRLPRRGRARRTTAKLDATAEDADLAAVVSRHGPLATSIAEEQGRERARDSTSGEEGRRGRGG